MRFQTLSELLQNLSYPILLLFIALLGFSAGLCQGPPLSYRREREKPRIPRRADREADCRARKHLGTGRPVRTQRGNGDEMNTSKDGGHGNIIDAMEQKMQATQEKAEVGLRKRSPQESNSRPAWLQSLSLGNGRPPRHTANGTAPKRAPEETERVVQRKASLTGEEVKELADAFIARVHQRMWVQRQESLKRHPHSPLYYEAPPSPS